jgi:hypothetical protein
MTVPMCNLNILLNLSIVLDAHPCCVCLSMLSSQRYLQNACMVPEVFARTLWCSEYSSPTMRL